MASRGEGPEALRIARSLVKAIKRSQSGVSFLEKAKISLLTRGEEVSWEKLLEGNTGEVGAWG